MADGERLLELLVQDEDRRRRGRSVTVGDPCRGGAAPVETLPEPVVAAPVPPLWPQFEGFTVLDVLGRGAMGVVYKARQIALGRIVALKIVQPGLVADPAELRRFHREAKATAALHHSNIVQIYQVGEYQGCPYLVLEFVDGRSLADVLDGTPVPARRAAELMLDLARAVQHAHEHGILHRDLKPANILLERGAPSAGSPEEASSALHSLRCAVPKIADFGLARLLDVDRGETRSGTVVGTPSYMAPEQAEGRLRDLGPATDVYGLGAILYELLTGRPPFKGLSVLETVEQVRTLEPIDPRSLRPDLPGDLERICLKCLEKKPANRYPTAAALADDLQRFLAGELPNARKLTVVEKIGRTIGYSGAPGNMRPRGWVVLAMSPLPVLLQLALLLIFGRWPSYPLICAIVGMSVACTMISGFFWASGHLLRQAPRLYRRFVWTLMSCRVIGFLMVPLLVALFRPGHNLAEYYLVFLWWVFLEGNFNLLMGIYFGGGYPAALVHYAAAMMIAIFPPIGPLVGGALISAGLVMLGTYLRQLGE